MKISYIYKHIPATLSGFVFLLSGLSKLGNVLIFQQLIVDYGLNHLNILAPFIILFEIFIGALLIFRIHVRAVSSIATIVVIIFTCTYTYAWHWHGITDCGCFGNYLPIHPTPLATYIRNAILIMLLVLAIIFDDSQQPERWKIVTMGTILYAATFVAGMTYKPFAFSNRIHPLENKAIADTPLTGFATTNNGESELLMFFSYGCPHCINSMENFKAWKEDNAVNNTIAYVLVDSTATHATDSLKLIFHERFPSINVIETNAALCPFIQAFPTSFLISNDTITHVIIGELPSHYLFQFE
ncbi:MAG: DoxX family protein [Paludibacteraceae bacterium]|nr:DoxX family protein [Paludibacteraceae bacterium]